MNQIERKTITNTQPSVDCYIKVGSTLSVDCYRETNVSADIKRGTTISADCYSDTNVSADSIKGTTIYRQETH